MSNSVGCRLLEGKDMKNFSFSVLQWNAGGLSSAKFSEIKKVIIEEDIDILVIQEANVTLQNLKNYIMKDFTFHALPKSRQIASGILVGVHRRLCTSFELVKTMNPHDTAEIVVINVWNDKSLFKIYGIYSPPNNNNLDLDILTTNRNTIIVGDLNAASPNWGYTYQNQVGKIVEDFIDGNALFVLYNKDDPNSFLHYSGSSTNPDITMVSANLVDYTKKTVLGDPGSGHRMIKTSIIQKIIQRVKNTKIMWNFSKANWKAYSEDLDKQLISVKNNITPHQALTKFTEALLSSAKKHIPRGKMKKYQPFWSEELETQREIRELARQKAENEKGGNGGQQRVAVQNWRKECAIMKRKVLEAKRQTWDKFLNNLDYRKDGKKAHHLLNMLNNKSVQRSNHPIKLASREISDNSQIANKFNDFFTGRFSLDKNKKREDTRLKRAQSKNYSERAETEKIFQENYTKEELNMALSDLKEKKQPGPDNIFPEFLTHLGQSSRVALLNIFNNFWNKKCSLPTDWLKAKVIPILKPGKPRERIESYRPIALTSCIAKTFEKMITTRLNYYLESKTCLAEEQTGFRSNMSTINSIMKLVHKVKTGFNLNNSTLAVYVDFQGAYDTIWRTKLIDKLHAQGIGGNMINWYKRFLAQRWIQTRWNEKDSKYKQSKLGLPQGAVSSCSLFNLYINDLVSRLKNIKGIEVSMFADDVVIWTKARNTRKFKVQKEVLEKTMNEALKILNSWSLDNNMSINKSKTAYQFFSLRHVNAEFKLNIDKVTLSKKNSTTYLGVILDNKLNFNDHIKYVTEKVENKIPIMKRLAGAKWGCNQNTLNKTYNTYVKPFIKYGSEVLLSIPKSKMDILERAQNKALRIITGAVKTTPILAMLKYTSNLPIAIEIKKQSLGTFIRLKASKKANWIPDRGISSLKTQVSPIMSCLNLLNELKVNELADMNINLVNPLDFMDIENYLEIDNSGKKGIMDPVLRTTTLCVLDEKYPEPEWTRIYTDGSKLQDKTGAGVYSKLFSHHASVGRDMSSFDAEIHAISLAMDSLIANTNHFTKAVILVDSMAAIQAVTLSQRTETLKISHIRQTIKSLKNNNKVIVFQWIPSHVGIEGNERADSLAKKGTQDQQITQPTSLGLLKKHIYNKIGTTHKTEQDLLSRGKRWEEIQESWKEYSLRSRMESVANFRLITGHDCLAEHLNRIGILSSSECQICRAGKMNAEHLLLCPGLDPKAQTSGDLSKLYWDARNVMNSL